MISCEGLTARSQTHRARCIAYGNQSAFPPKQLKVGFESVFANAIKDCVDAFTVGRASFDLLCNYILA